MELAASFAPTNSYLLETDELPRYRWLVTLESQVNPTLQAPTSSTLISIGYNFLVTLFTLVLSDLRSECSGRRVHLWEERRCVITYNLTPRRGMVDVLGLKTMDDAEAREYMDLIMGFVNEAGWVYCPNTMDAVTRFNIDISQNLPLLEDNTQLSPASTYDDLSVFTLEPTSPTCEPPHNSILSHSTARRTFVDLRIITSPSSCPSSPSSPCTASSLSSQLTGWTTPELEGPKSDDMLRSFDYTPPGTPIACPVPFTMPVPDFNFDLSHVYVSTEDLSLHYSMSSSPFAVSPDLAETETEMHKELPQRVPTPIPVIPRVHRNIHNIMRMMEPIPEHELEYPPTQHVPPRAALFEEQTRVLPAPFQALKRGAMYITRMAFRLHSQFVFAS
ncbi:uncharacterized protein EI90DRAFT_3156916 [Cantharellus anzutake]|uniref:uncharacterized protein n=1 Tax=Cantharellus anzutake TaxID=1750568 RepID=UPI0019085DFF|nr:uncharacterized protein EI90DRAFT_3156916 [Cantharellus anzutake]KAF8325540.1 hypothetical protein EI90DRAFT_3156916 [Cantharellus anzutake]